MARVNHRKVKELKAEKRKSITDRQFFTSRLLAGHFSDIAMAQTRRYKFSRRVKVSLEWKPRDTSIAHVAFNVIWINTGHKLVTSKKTREERYDIVAGLFTHELGHVFYTPFTMAQTHNNYFGEQKLFPERPCWPFKEDKLNEAAMWKYLKDNPDKMEGMRNLVHTISNVIEDGFIECKMLDRYPGILGHGLTQLRDSIYEETPTLTQHIECEGEGEQHIWHTILALILSYMRFGELKYGEEPMSDERVQVVFSLLGDLDKALVSQDPKDRFRAVNVVAVRCWPYIQDFLEHCQTEMSSMGAGSLAEAIKKALSSMAGASAAPEGTSGAVDDDGPAIRISASGKRAMTARQAAASAGKDAEEEEEKPDSEDEPAEDDEKDSADDSGEDDSEMETLPPESIDTHGDEDGTAAQNVSSEEQGRIPMHQTDNLYEPTGGSTERDEEYTGSGYTKSAEDIHDLLEDMAERAAFDELETERSIALNSLAKNISFGDIHSGCDFKVHRVVDVSDDLVDEYREVAPELLHISNLLKRSILLQLQDRQKGGKQTGLMMGRKLEARALHRKDGKPFYKNNLPNDRPEMAIALLLDESGSMAGCDRATYARASAVILHDFCRSLNIPVMVYGHSTSYTGVDLYSYAEFDTIDRDDSFRLMDISARSSNRDGAALRFVAEQLVKRPEEFKMLILVSDGQPAAPGYSGTAAEEDLRGIKHEYKRKGVTFVAAAIGDDKENIKRIYGDSFRATCSPVKSWGGQFQRPN